MRCVFTWLALLMTCQTVRANDAKLDVRETPVGNVNAVVVETITSSPDGRRLAYAARVGEKLVLTVDGKPASKPYDGFGAGGIVFSPSSARVAAMVSASDGKWLLVVDGEEGKPFDTFAKDSLTFSADSRHVAAVAARGAKRLAVVDGVEGPAYDDVKAFAFAPTRDDEVEEESQAVPHFAYAAREGARWRIVTESANGEWFDEVGDQPIVYAPDGKRIVYAARRFDRWFIVDDGKTGPPYEDIAAGTIRLSPDRTALAYVARRDAAWAVVVNGKPVGQNFNAIDPATLAFSLDGTSVVFAARSGASWSVVQGETPGPAFDELAFPPVVGPARRGPVYVGVRAGKHIVVHDDGQEDPACDEVMEPPVVSSDGRLAYAARRGARQFVVLDGKDGPAFDAVGRLAFSPDGKRLAYGAQRGNAAVVRVDDLETGPFNGFLPRSRLVFDDDGNTVHAQTFRGEQLLQVAIQILSDAPGNVTSPSK